MYGVWIATSGGNTTHMRLCVNGRRVDIQAWVFWSDGEGHGSDCKVDGTSAVGALLCSRVVRQ